MRTISGAIFAALLLWSAALAAEESADGPKMVFRASFIQYSYCQNWEPERWREEMDMLKAVGIEELILQTVADTGSRYAAYPTQIDGYTAGPTDMVGRALAAAEEAGLRIRLGLGFNKEWWGEIARETAWLEREAAANTAIVDELWSRYGHSPALAGWYIPHELSAATAPAEEHQQRFNDFYRTIAARIREHSDLNIRVSPFYNSSWNAGVSLPEWTELVKNVLKDTGVDEVALQDGVGAGHNTLEQLPALFEHTQQATDALGVRFLANIETFDTDFRPAPFERIVRQFELERPYVEGFIAFSVNHYQSGCKPAQADGYAAYKEHYLRNR